VKRHGDDAADVDFLARFVDAFAVDPHMALIDQLWASVRLFSSRMKKRKRSILTSS